MMQETRQPDSRPSILKMYDDLRQRPAGRSTSSSDRSSPTTTPASQRRADERFAQIEYARARGRQLGQRFGGDPERWADAVSDFVEIRVVSREQLYRLHGSMQRAGRQLNAFIELADDPASTDDKSRIYIARDLGEEDFAYALAHELAHREMPASKDEDRCHAFASGFLSARGERR